MYGIKVAMGIILLCSAIGCGNQSDYWQRPARERVHSSMTKASIERASVDTTLPCGIDYTEANGSKSRFVFTIEGADGRQACILRPGLPPEPLEFPAEVAENVHIGFADVQPGKRDIFILMYNCGTGYDEYVLWLFNTQLKQFAGLTIYNAWDQATPFSKLTAGGDFHDRRLAPEREFLEELKYDFGYYDSTMVTKGDAWRLAPYNWLNANGKVKDGTLKLRRISGLHPFLSSPTFPLTDGDIVYTAFFKGCVWAYDKKRDESFVVYSPTDMYDWPDKLLKSGDWLLIGTCGQATAIVNTRTWNFRRLGVSCFPMDKFEVLDNKGIIDGNTVVPLPTLPTEKER